MILSALLGSLFLCLHSEVWRIRCAKDECLRLTQWLTVRYERAIIESRHFSLTVAGGGILTSQISLTWYNPLVSESFVIESCFLARLGNYSLARYNPLYRTLSPGMTLSILKDSKSMPWGKLVLPVKGTPRLEWFGR
ncbi:hypothetical protein SAMN06275492_12433 [Dethiosulfovibrio salsuginis]|uniref:Tfp pilus assembly protein FimT n=1 Tax=Dethiosulfovibrio salsuginis TaxID=561720 RepID=A0A1X7KB95_9BACT|nr:hypothetical protein SAMN06275492_12433 [Dethiosulfovibrio salsuginis]